MRILIADDNENNNRILANMLQAYGEVEVVSDGLEALNACEIAIIANDYFGLICLDIRMPELDGMEALMYIRALETQYHRAPSRIFMITALHDDNSIDRSYERHCDGYIVKPVRKKVIYNEFKKVGILPPPDRMYMMKS